VEGPRQGDYLPRVAKLYVTGPEGQAVEHPTPLGVVLISQCCDLARPDAGNIPVAAAVVELSGSGAANASSGRTPRYAKALQLSGNRFVDFGVTGAISYEQAADEERVGLAGTQDRLLFASRVSRRFSRFAYPDEVQPFIRNLQRRIRSKARSISSSLGRCIDRIQTIRVEADWDSGPPWALTIVFVLKEGELPTVGEAPPSEGQLQLEYGLTLIADTIAGMEPGSPGLDYAWNRLAEALLAEAASDVTAAVVSEAVPEVLQESEFSYYRYRWSADLDVDDLSDADEE
jgi:hypothetical protein